MRNKWLETLFAQTMALQLAQPVKPATNIFQYAAETTRASPLNKDTWSRDPRCVLGRKTDPELGRQRKNPAAHVTSRKYGDGAVLWHKIPAVPDVQEAWLLLLHYASARVDYLPREAADFARWTKMVASPS